MIVASEIELRAGARLLLEGASFQVGAGDRIGLVGRNGAGKTTLAKVLAIATIAGGVFFFAPAATKEHLLAPAGVPAWCGFSAFGAAFATFLSALVPMNSALMPWSSAGISGPPPGSAVTRGWRRTWTVPWTGS